MALNRFIKSSKPEKGHPSDLIPHVWNGYSEEKKRKAWDAFNKRYNKLLRKYYIIYLTPVISLLIAMIWIIFSIQQGTIVFIIALICVVGCVIYEKVKWKG